MSSSLSCGRGVDLSIGADGHTAFCCCEIARYVALDACKVSDKRSRAHD